MKTPTLKEVKEYFKNAKEVRVLTVDKKVLNYQELKDTLHYDNGAFWLKDKDKDQIIVNVIDHLVLYAEIVSYIEPQFTLTKGQLSYLHSIDSVKETIEEWFPSEFIKLEYGKWYKCNFNNNRISLQLDKNTRYGFDRFGNWIKFDNSMADITKELDWTLATPQEVKEALTKEAVKRGFKDGVTISAKWGVNNWTISKNIEFKFNSTTNCLEMWSDIAETKKDGYIDASKGHLDIFKDGIWAEIVSEPIEVTLEEIAKLKGVDVSLIKIVK